MDEQTREGAQGMVNKLYSLNDINEVSRMLSLRWSYLESLKVAEFQKGQRVRFRDKQDNDVIGVVIKVNQKTITVEDEDDCRRSWRVSPHLIDEVII